MLLVDIRSYRMHAWVKFSGATAAGLASEPASCCAVDCCDSFRAKSFR
jgi:hypothetical protein